MKPKRQHFEAELQRRLTAAAAAGQSAVKVNSGELHTSVGGYPEIMSPG